MRARAGIIAILVTVSVACVLAAEWPKEGPKVLWTTPAVDGGSVYSFGPLGDLYSINATTGKPVWNKNPWKEFGGSRLPTWALTQNPLVYHDSVIVAAQAPQATVVAYNKLSGEMKWKSGESPLFDKGGVVLADGLLLIRDHKNLKCLAVAHKTP